MLMFFKWCLSLILLMLMLIIFLIYFYVFYVVIKGNDVLGGVYLFNFRYSADFVDVSMLMMMLHLL